MVEDNGNVYWNIPEQPSWGYVMLAAEIRMGAMNGRMGEEGNKQGVKIRAGVLRLPDGRE